MSDADFRFQTEIWLILELLNWNCWLMTFSGNTLLCKQFPWRQQHITAPNSPLTSRGHSLQSDPVPGDAPACCLLEKTSSNDSTYSFIHVSI